MTAHYPGLNDAIERVLDPRGWAAPGPPPLRWTLHSTRRVSLMLKAEGFNVSPSTARKQMKRMGYCFQSATRHMFGALRGPEGHAQFAYINGRASSELRQGNPVLCLESRRLVKGEAPPLGRLKARPYPEPSRRSAMCRGLYDLARLKGGSEIVTGRTDSEFAAHSIYGWWKAEGKAMFPKAPGIYLTVGRGGCAFASMEPWLDAACKLAEKIRLPVEVSHFLPGTSRWDPGAERRIFSFWSTSWGGEAPADYETVVSLVAWDRDPEPLDVLCRLNHRACRHEPRQSSGGREALVTPSGFKGDWNYTVALPRRPRTRNRSRSAAPEVLAAAFPEGTAPPVAAFAAAGASAPEASGTREPLAPVDAERLAAMNATGADAMRAMEAMEEEERLYGPDDGFAADGADPGDEGCGGRPEAGGFGDGEYAARPGDAGGPAGPGGGYGEYASWPETDGGRQEVINALDALIAEEDGEDGGEA